MEYHFSDRISNVRPSAIREILKYAASHPEVIALSTGSPANEAIPVDEISAISARIFRDMPLAGLQYSMTEGYPALRESTRQRLKKEFGIGREFDDLIITTGGQQGLSLTPNIFCNPGDTVVVELPTFVSGINAMRTIGLIGGCSHAELGNCTRRTLLHMAVPMQHTADSGAYEVIPALTEIDVLAAAGTHACVIFGDSTVANELPRLLAARLRADGIENVSVTQAAIKGDRLVADGVGRAAKLLGGAGVKRFARDVLAQAGADMVLVKLGANDLIHPHCQSKQGLLTPVTFAQMTAGYRALADMAHAQGMRIWFCELTPWKGYTRNLFGRGDDIQWSPEYDALRLELNAWFQGADCPADGYIPLDALADPNDPDALVPAYTTDGVHHTPAGQRALAALIPEDIFVT